MAAARMVVLAGLLNGCAEADSPAHSQLFVTDYRANAIVRYDGATGELAGVFAAGIDQRVDRPASVQRGPDGQLYSAGFGRGEVVRYDLVSGAMMDVFFADTTLLEEPVELAFHSGALLVLGNDTRNIVVIDAAGQPMRELGYPTMRAPHDFVIGRDDQIFVATETNPELGTAIQVWDLATGAFVRHFGDYSELAFASGLTLHDDELYVCDFERGQVTRFDPVSGTSLGVLIDGLVAPVRVDIGPDGALYVLDSRGLQRFDRATGAYLGQFVAVDGETLQRPLGFTFVH